MKKNIVIIIFLAIIAFRCSPRLNYNEIASKVNRINQSELGERADAIIGNTPSAFYEQRDKESRKKELTKLFENSDLKINYSDIKNLVVDSRKKCNIVFYYKIRYEVTRSEFAPYLDSTALSFNYKNYGKENVIFNDSSKILTTSRTEDKILIFDDDKSRKILELTSSHLDRYYGNGFSQCVKND
jgi:hypothetical protein